MAKLSERKEKILQSLVEDYIESASPVSSSIIQSKHLPELSSATIRNELAALEEMGYLHQPHTSAGRVPTAQAYKAYVERLMPKHKLTKDEIKQIRTHFDKEMLSMRDVMKSTARLISEVTQYTSLALVTDITEAVIENIKVVRLSPANALVIVVTNLGILKDATVRLDRDYPDGYFEAVGELALSVFRGKTVQDVRSPDQTIDDLISQYQIFFDTIMDILDNYSASHMSDDMILEGASKILQYPEYNDIEKAKAVMMVLDDKEHLMPMLESGKDVQLNISIGTGGTGDPLTDCAIVTVNYIIDGKNVGKAGVIGPLRMDYAKVVSVLDYISKAISASGSARLVHTQEQQGEDHEG